MLHNYKNLPYKKIVLFTILVLFTGLVTLEFWKDRQTYTVLQGEQNNGLGATYGYKIENYRYSHGTRIMVWTRVGLTYTMRSIHEMPQLTIDRVGGHEWINSGDAIYLSFKIIDNSSLNTIHPMQLVYDFHTGQMYVTSDLALWRILSNDRGRNDWINEKEFDEILVKLRSR